MRWEIRIAFQDRDLNLRHCTTRAAGLTSIAQLIQFANAFGDAAQGVSNARLVGGLAYAKAPLITDRAAALTSNVGRKLLLLTSETATEQFGSLVIPSPADTIPWPTEGDYPFRLRKSDLPVGHQIRTWIDTALPLMVRPDDQPMPTTDWVLGLMSE